MADVAQLVESQIVILVVAGSSPVVRPTSLFQLACIGSLGGYTVRVCVAFRASSLVLSLA